jgi:hypothetical protein
MRTARTLPSSLRLIAQFLLLGFFLTPVMVVGQDSDSDWSVDEEWQDDVWTITGGDDIVRASVNGKITHGDRLRVILRPSDRCRNTILSTSFYTYSKEPDIGSLRNVPVVFQIYDGEMEEGTIDFMIPLFNRHMAWINLFNLPLPAIKEMFEIMNKRSDEIQITLKNSNTLETEKYFDIPTNTWSLEGSMEALDRAEQLCLRMQQGNK